MKLIESPVVTSIIGTASQISASNPTGDVTLSTIGPYTPTSYTLNGVIYGNSTSSLLATAQGPANSVLTANAGAPSFSATPTVTSLAATSLTSGRLALSSTAGLIADSANFLWTSSALTVKVSLNIAGASANGDFSVRSSNSNANWDFAAIQASGNFVMSDVNNSFATPLVLEKLAPTNRIWIGVGGIGFGSVTAPTALAHLGAGTATANTAPLKFNSGTLLTAAEAGAVEFLTDAWYGTITTGAARKTFAFLESPVFTGTVTLPTVTQTGKTTTYNNIATVSNGNPSELATIDLTGRTANIGATTLYAVPASGVGMYRISAYVVETTAGSLSSTLPNVQIVYTDADTGGVITIDATPILGVAGIGQTGALNANTVGTASSGVIAVYVKASTTMQYQTVNYASNLSGMAYSLRIKLEAL